MELGANGLWLRSCRWFGFLSSRRSMHFTLQYEAQRCNNIGPMICVRAYFEVPLPEYTIVVSILFSIIPVLTQYTIVVSILFSIIPILPQYTCVHSFWKEKSRHATTEQVLKLGSAVGYHMNLSKPHRSPP